MSFRGAVRFFPLDRAKPAKFTKTKKKKCISQNIKLFLKLYEDVHARVRTAAFVIAAVELPFPVKKAFKVLALHASYDSIAGTCRGPAKTNKGH